MKITQTTYTLADFCAAHDRGELIVNNNYQRSDKVWPPAARSFLIESILLGYPIPKLYLYQVTDIRTRTTRKEIVDGQQRSRAIFDFYANSLRLTRTLETEELRGQNYDDLSQDRKQSFLDYALTADLFVGALPEDIREVFRRMNSYTVPLNPEEKRHATYQGLFKWFIYKLAKEYGSLFLQMDVFKSKAIVRMADAKLLTEICHAMLNGIKTTNAKMLDDLYRSRDKAFIEEDDLKRRLLEALDDLLTWEAIYNTSLSKPHVFYSMVLAIMHSTKPLPQLETICAGGKRTKDNETIIEGLTALASALENREGETFRTFVDASIDRTNVADHREKRMQWFCKALQGELPS